MGTKSQRDQRDSEIKKLLAQRPKLSNGMISAILHINYGEVREALKRIGAVRKNGRPKQVYHA